MIFFLATLGWLTLLFVLARLADARPAWQRLSEHPLVYALSLGVYATSWTFYGAVGLARTQGLTFLAVSFGPAAAALLVPAVWTPLLRLVRRQQLATIADLFAFRYRSHALGVLVTLAMLLGILPYLAVQIRAVAHSAMVVAPGLDAATVGAAFTGVMLVFATLFGARHATTRERHPGLVVAIAFESVFKLVALLAVGAGALWLFPELRVDDPARTARLTSAVTEGNFTSVFLLSTAAAFLLPRQFHMAFTEAPEGAQGERGLRTAAWAFPLFLALINLPLPLVLWAGERLAPEGNADLFVLRVAGQVPGLEPIAWLGGVSAASAMTIVASIALSSMVLAHLVLPFRRPSGGELYAGLVQARRLVIAALLAAAFGVFVLLEHAAPAATARGGGLAQVGLVSFAGVLQLVPGFLGVLFFPRATRTGVTWGLVLGVTAWGLLLALPVVGISVVEVPPSLLGLDRLAGASLLSIALNGAVVAFGSLSSAQTPEEARAALACRSEVDPVTGQLPPTVDGFVERIAPVLGHAAARVEVQRAAQELTLAPDERRPGELVRLAARLEANLTGLLGPVLSHAALTVAPAADEEVPFAVRLRRLEAEVEAARQRGGASAAEALQAWLRGVFAALPVGVGVVGPDGVVVWWNPTLEHLTGLRAVDVVGAPLASLGDVARAFETEGPHALQLGGRSLTWDVSSATLGATSALPGGRVVVVEDLTAQRALETQVRHHERLASIGRLAAGVAHEVGNPLAAIMIVAQNLQREGADGADLAERLEGILSSARRIDEIVKSLVTFARGERPGERVESPVDVERVVREAARLSALARRREPVVSLEPGLPRVQGVEAELVQVLVNLLNNAADASPPGAAITLTARSSGDALEVLVEDHGAGMPAEVQARLFEPFFTTKDPGQGTGLGLPIVYNLVTAHRGRVEVKSAPGEGTRVTVRLPAAR